MQKKKREKLKNWKKITTNEKISKLQEMFKNTVRERSSII